MAGIDHTIIPFHNGRLMREMFRVINDEFISLIPFEYTRDGEITGVSFDRVIEIPQYYSNTKLGDWIIRKIGTRMDKNYVCLYQKDAVAILVYKSADYNVTFIWMAMSLMCCSAVTVIGNVLILIFTIAVMVRHSSARWPRSVISGSVKTFFR